MNKWDKRFFSMAQDVQEWSKDPRRRVGALLVSPDRRSVSWGYNGLPSKLDDTMLEHLSREDKNRIIIHAEQNAIDNCPSKVRGWTMYVTLFPCAQCAGALIQNGIKRVVTPPIDRNSNWVQEMDMALVMLETVGIEVVQLEGWLHD